jgi:hypothetical protein
MTPGWPIWKSLMAMKDYIPDYKVSPDLFKNPMAAPKTVFW